MSAPPNSSPFPSHSLDNTTWAARNDNDRFASFETSSSSSDDEIRERDWGNTSGILIRGAEGDDQPAWTAEDEEAKVKEATDALRVLFPMSSPDEEPDAQAKIELNQLDNRVATSDTSSLAETASTATAQAFSRGQLRGKDVSSVALTQWTGASSPVPSPNLKTFVSLAPESSPTQHLSRLRSSFDPEEMEVDEEGHWLDESGEFPVRADDTFSDVDLGSTMGDAPTPEHERRLQIPVWAQEAAEASTTFGVKQEEPDDYPSPLTADADDSGMLYHASRASSSEASHTPSSGSSDLPPFEMDSEGRCRGDYEEVLVGPESVTVEEIDGWLPAVKAEKTPRRGRDKNRHQASRCSGNWGSIGVGSPFPAPVVKFIPEATVTKSPVARTRSMRASNRRRKSSSCNPAYIVKEEQIVSPPPIEADAITSRDVKIQYETVEEADAFGPADLEEARVEAEAREEQHRKYCKEKADQQKALLEAYRQRMMEAHGPETESWDQSAPSPWPDMGAAPWGSSDSLNLAPPSALSPMVFTSMSALSLFDLPSSMDPRALHSPPVAPRIGGPVDELLVAPESGESSPGLPLIPMSAPLPHMAPIPPLLPPAAASAPLAALSPLPAPMPAPQSAAPPPSPPTFSPALPCAPIYISAAASTSSATPIAVVQPTSAPEAAKAQPVASESAPSPAIVDLPTSLLADISRTPTPSPASAKPHSQAPESSKASSPASSSPSASGTTSASGKLSLCLLPGVFATVVDNIPMYQHDPERLPPLLAKSQRPSRCVYRRLDTDFVNATDLLLALGVPHAKHQTFLSIPSPHLSAHTTMAARAPNGIAYGQGVAGVWVHLNEAKEYVKRLKVDASNPILNILDDGLFKAVRIISTANLMDTADMF
jgi:hypothetical protein